MTSLIGPETAEPPKAVIKPGCQVNVRFDEQTRARLDEVARQTQRTLSQLVRYATSWWLTDPSLSCPLTVERVGDGRHVNVRFDGPSLLALDGQVQQVGLDRSSIVRCAVRSWMQYLASSADERARLGVPAMSTESRVA